MSDVQRAVKLARTLLDIRAKIEEQQMVLEDLKVQERRVEQEDLPELMRELELSSFKMEDGSTVSVVEDVQCAITEARRAEAHSWLISNGHGGLIKTEVKVAFPAGCRDNAAEFAVENSGEMKEFIHPQTLKAFVREQLESGVNLPMEAFGVRAFNRAKIDLPKKSKTR